MNFTSHGPPRTKGARGKGPHGHENKNIKEQIVKKISLEYSSFEGGLGKGLRVSPTYALLHASHRSKWQGAQL